MIKAGKKPWHMIEPKDAVAIQLPHPDIQGPYTQEGEECPWPWDPIQLVGVPMGQYHCGYCGEMCMAGMEHLDFGPKDENGLSFIDREYIAWAEEDKRGRQNGDRVDNWESEGGASGNWYPR